ncbi:MAG: hypothetical protein ACRDSJ_21170 [Rubrobacteraceae bacterium]
MSDAAKRDDEEIKRRVLENLDALDRTGKLEVLDLSEASSLRRDTRAALLKHAGAISAEDLDLIREAIEEGCERVDEEGWQRREPDGLAESFSTPMSLSRL